MQFHVIVLNLEHIKTLSIKEQKKEKEMTTLLFIYIYYTYKFFRQYSDHEMRFNFQVTRKKIVRHNHSRYAGIIIHFALEIMYFI